MFSVFFREERPVRYEQVKEADSGRFNAFFWAMLDRGVYLAPSAFEAGFVSTTHTEAVIAEVLDAASEALSSMEAR